jgi:hypothetical protein
MVAGRPKQWVGKMIKAMDLRKIDRALRSQTAIVATIRSYLLQSCPNCLPQICPVLAAWPLCFCHPLSLRSGDGNESGTGPVVFDFRLLPLSC